MDSGFFGAPQRRFGFAFQGFPLDRVVEMHVASGTVVDVGGLQLIDDDHAPEPLPDTWEIFERAVARASNLRAVVYECEKNPVEDVVANFSRINALARRGAPA